MAKKEKFTLEALMHLVLHFLGVVLLFWVVIVPPFWLALLLFVGEYLQMKMLGNCFLTVWAHKRGYMKGLSYWEYFFKVLGLKDYVTAKKVIDYSIKFALVSILVSKAIWWKLY